MKNNKPSKVKIYCELHPFEDKQTIVVQQKGPNQRYKVLTADLAQILCDLYVYYTEKYNKCIMLDEQNYDAYNVEAAIGDKIQITWSTAVSIALICPITFYNAIESDIIWKMQEKRVKYKLCIERIK